MGDFDLTMDELRAVTRFVVVTAEEVQPVFAQACPGDPRPRTAIDAAWRFVDGGSRTRLQRVASLEAHRAAAEAPTDVARLAARAAGDAASAAYLHPLANGRQVGHILRAAACAARIRELTNDQDPSAATAAIEDARERAPPTVIEVLGRYPAYPARGNRIDELISLLDSSLRASR